MKAHQFILRSVGLVGIFVLTIGCGTGGTTIWGGDDLNGQQDLTTRGDESCQPSCEGKQCGDDGCGGVCGDCGDGTDCKDNACVEFQSPEQCLGLDEPSAADCGDITYEGCCDNMGWVLFCQGGALYCLDCNESEGRCGWKLEDSSYYDL